MNVETIASYKYYVELYRDLTITISNIKNNGGTILVDDNDNRFGKPIHSGSNYIKSVDFNLDSPIILYDDRNFVYIDDSYEGDVFLIKPMHYINYKVNAYRVTDLTLIGNKIMYDMSNKNVFKLFINGREVKNYIKEGDGIVILFPDYNYITEIMDDIILYIYDDDQTIIGNLILTYESPTVLLPYLSDLEGSYFDDFTRKIEKFTDFGVKVNKELQVINKPFEYNNLVEENSRTSKLDISMYEDLRHYLKDNKFRILAFDEVNSRLKIFSNCKWKEGENINFNLEKVEYTYNIEFEDEIIVTYSGNATAYGSGIYGEGSYGGITYNIENVRL